MGTPVFHPVTNLPNVNDPKSFSRWLDSFNESVKSEKVNELIPCYLVILEVRNALLDEKVPLVKLSKEYVSQVLIRVITTLIKNLNEYKGKDGSVESVKKNLRDARVQLNTALGLFDKKKDPDLLYRRINALSLTEEELTKALNYWYHIGEILEKRNS